MFILSNFLVAIAELINMALTLYMWLIIIRALISWVNPDPYNIVVQTLYRMTEPVLYRIRRILPIGGMGIDFSPIILIFIIIFLQRFFVVTLKQIAINLG